jgi:hypothetical protein
VAGVDSEALVKVERHSISVGTCEICALACSMELDILLCVVQVIDLLGAIGILRINSHHTRSALYPALRKSCIDLVLNLLKSRIHSVERTTDRRKHVRENQLSQSMKVAVCGTQFLQQCLDVGFKILDVLPHGVLDIC